VIVQNFLLWEAGEKCILIIQLIPSLVIDKLLQNHVVCHSFCFVCEKLRNKPCQAGYSSSGTFFLYMLSFLFLIIPHTWTMPLCCWQILWSCVLDFMKVMVHSSPAILACLTLCYHEYLINKNHLCTRIWRILLGYCPLFCHLWFSEWFNKGAWVFCFFFCTVSSIA